MNEAILYGPRDLRNAEGEPEDGLRMGQPSEVPVLQGQRVFGEDSEGQFR